jgi:phosphoribosylformylglycinamidine synthase
MSNVNHWLRKDGDDVERCFNVETTKPLTPDKEEILFFLLANGFDKDRVVNSSGLNGNVIEVGPRMNFETPWSSNMVSICQSIGLEEVTRIERSRRHVVPVGASNDLFIAGHHDRMTECLYPAPLTTFSTGLVPEDVYEVPLMEGPDILREIPGISMDDWDRQLYYDYFVKRYNRNPTIVEILDLNNANSEHSRHGYFKGKHVLDGKEMPETLFEIVISTWKANSGNSVIAFKDNSSGIYGRKIQTIIPITPGRTTSFEKKTCLYHITFTAETHNFPTGVAPFPGAATGTGGRIRDGQATGQGSLVVAGTAGYCVSNLFIPGYELPWEHEHERPDTLASGLEIELEASNGASDYGNKFGEPLIQGFTRSFDMRLPNKQRWGFLKPIMFTGGVGQIADGHTEKDDPEKGMLIVQIGGPAYRVGFGGGAASSHIQGDQAAKLDFNAVQRGNPEMEQKMNRVIRACVEMGINNPIASIHDQGAGGPANVLKELVEKSGGRVDIRKINVGDPTMSILEIWVAEFQERNGFLISFNRIEEFKAICKREKVNCEVLGEATDDGIFIAYDSADNTKPVELNLKELLGEDVPQKTFEDKTVDPELEPFIMPDGETFKDALTRVLKLPSVGSKRFLTNKVDRCVTGLVAQQQCCGPLGLTVSDSAVIAQSHFPNKNGKYSGAAISIGEQPIKMLVNPAAGARMAVGEAVTNMAGVKIDGLDLVKCSANWMWAPKLSGEGVALYEAAGAMRDVMIKLGVAVDGGKDSLSMATRVGKETVKSPRELVISAYSTMEDVTKVVTPDIKKPGETVLLHINFSPDHKCRLGGSALAQVYGQIGDESPDMDNPEIVVEVFNTIQHLIDEELILSIHDIGDGGLFTTLLEMAFAGNCGLKVSLDGEDEFSSAFAEELGLVIECEEKKVMEIMEYFLWDNTILCSEVAETIKKKQITAHMDMTRKLILDESMISLRQIWEETSYQLDRLQANPECVEKEKENIFDRTGPTYNLLFELKETAPEVFLLEDKPKVAILREEGSNSDREMTSAFFQVGFEPYDVTMTDLLNGDVSLDMFQGLAAVGGFSYADAPESAKGWAAAILFNDKLRKMFDDFYNRPNTFSLGICNGCQLFGLLGWVPWKNIDHKNQPRFVHNDSGRFESRWSTVTIPKNNSIMLQGMEGSVLGIHVDHGEGRFKCPDKELLKEISENGHVALTYANDDGSLAERGDYPFNPNGSILGIAGLCTTDGRHTAMMPHPERAFINWQWHDKSQQSKEDLDAKSPWFKMFQNAYEWCMKNR